MQRRLGGEDIERSNPLLSNRERHRPFYWRVYEKYEFLPSPVSDFDCVQAASRGGKDPECTRIYNPLIDTPYLFLEFARIGERKDQWQALKAWIAKYGLLGLTPRNPRYSQESSPLGKRLDSFVPLYRYDDRGGPDDTLDFVFAEVEQTNYALRLYEMAVSRDEAGLERALYFEDDPFFEEGWEKDPEALARRQHNLHWKAETTGGRWIDVLIDAAMGQVLEFTVYPVRDFTYPDIAYPQNSIDGGHTKDSLLNVHSFGQGWGARNLLGAMHLQFFWLVTSGKELSRCKHCGRIMSPASEMPESRKRKPRKDKEFCDSRCRQNYHYHNRIKSTQDPA